MIKSIQDRRTADLAQYGSTIEVFRHYVMTAYEGCLLNMTVIELRKEIRLCNMSRLVEEGSSQQVISSSSTGQTNDSDADSPLVIESDDSTTTSTSSSNKKQSNKLKRSRCSKNTTLPPLKVLGIRDDLVKRLMGEAHRILSHTTTTSIRHIRHSELDRQICIELAKEKRMVDITVNKVYTPRPRIV